MQKPSSKYALRYWPWWLLVAILWLLARLPFRWGLSLFRLLGTPLHALMKSRRRIAARNISRCLPRLSAAERQQLLRDCFHNLGLAIGEFTYAWTGSRSKVLKQGEVLGMDNLARARKGGNGVLIVTCHMTCLEMAGRIMSEQMDNENLAGLYRPLKNPVMEWFQNQGRARYTGAMIPKRDTRSAIRHLRGGGVLWYAPDQDFGAEHSIFAPIFGIQAATLTATHRLARLGRARVIMMFVRRLQNGRYEARFLPHFEAMPSADMLADLTEINAQTEVCIRQAPSQYWWIHRRFKTRPPEEADFYGD